jgi:hypothetical protein
LAQDAEIVIPDKEGAIIPNIQLLWSVARELLTYADVINGPLQFAGAISWTGDATFLNRNLAETDVQGAATLTPITGEACVGVPAHNSRQVTSAHLLDLW